MIQFHGFSGKLKCGVMEFEVWRFVLASAEGNMTFLVQQVKHVVFSVAPKCDDLARSVAKADN